VESKLAKVPKFKISLVVDKAAKVLAPPAGKSSKKVQFNTSGLKTRLQYLLSQMCQDGVSLNVRFCGLAEMQAANAYFRKKNKPTDVLSFPPPPQSLGMHEPTERQSFGDILICVPVCYDQARRHRVTLAEELDRMIVHGVVHLRGFDHERSDSDQRVMTGLEKLLRKELLAAHGIAEWVREMGDV
jgi:probable rRNA maturation factor